MRVPLARRQLLHEPLKLGLALAGVALAVALVALLFALREGIGRQVTTFEDNAGADVYVAARGTRDFVTPGAATLPTAIGRQLRAVPGVTEAAPLTDTLGILRLHDKRVATLQVGFEPGAVGSPWQMSEGRAPRGGGEIAVDSVLADTHGLHPGDIVQLRDRPLRIVGLTDRTASWMTPLIFVTRATANRLQGRPDSASFFLLRVSGRSPEAVRADVGRRFPQLSVLTRRQIAGRDRALMTESFNPIVEVMVLIALGVGAMVIGLTAYGFVSERRREYGALKAIGERSGRLYRLVSTQALAIAGAGLVAGVVLAQGAAAAIEALWPKFLFVSLPSHFVLLVAASVVMGLLGALMPVRLLARLDPAEVFRG